jgi:Type II secretion system (T2SS), protein K
MNSHCPNFRSSSTRAASRRRGSVLVIVMITLIFTTLALVAFIEKASADLLVEARAMEATRLRAEAYSALETTLAVLDDFRAVGGGLHNPAEGWNDPLAFAAWAPKEGRTVEIAFEDESGKLSLPRADALVLTSLFKAWEMPDADAEKLADALLGWMKRDHVYSSPISPDYEQSPLPYEPPGRSLRSFDELAAIDVVRDVFFKDGKPNELWYRFVNSVSLFSFRQSNINGAKPDILGSHGQFDDAQQQQLMDYLSGAGAYKIQGPGWFTDMSSVRTLVGLAGNPTGFGTTISALRVSLVVREGQSVFRLCAVVAPLQNGATTVQATASTTRTATPTGAAQGSSAQQRPSNTAQTSANPNAASNAKKLNYPFTLLEIRENDEIVQAPPPTVAASL